MADSASIRDLSCKKPTSTGAKITAPVHIERTVKESDRLGIKLSIGRCVHSLPALAEVDSAATNGIELGIHPINSGDSLTELIRHAAFAGGGIAEPEFLVLDYKPCISTVIYGHGGDIAVEG